MSQANTRDFGIQSQSGSENLTPSPAGDQAGSHKKFETLSDVGGRGISGPLAASLSDSDEVESVRRRSACEGVSEDRNGLRSEAPQQRTGPQRHEVLAEVFGVTPDTDNMGVTIRQEAGGIDTLEVCCYGYWQLSQWHELRPALERARHASEAGYEEAAYITTAEGDRIEVAPTGRRHGIYCRYVLHWQGCDLSIVDNPAPSDQRLSVQVRIGSITLMTIGHVEAWHRIQSLLTQLGFCMGHNIVSRVDICTDHAHEPMEQVADAEHQGRMIYRSRKKVLHKDREKLETLSVGARSSILLRIYNKAREVRNDPVKQAVVANHRWGEFCTEAIRVEFELRGKALRRHFDITTVEELFNQLGTIAHWCTHDWFRIVQDFDRGNRNHSRAVVAAFWEKVQAAFRDWTGEKKERKKRKRKLLPNFKQLGQQAVGCVVSIVAHSEQKVDDLRMAFMSQWVQTGDRFLDKAVEAIRQKRHVVVAAGRDVFINEADIPF